MTSGGRIVVYGAYGHTGRQVVSEFVDLGFTPVPAGRDLLRVSEVARAHGLDPMVASVEEPDTLAKLLADADAVVNCAGPFGVTADPLAAAALRTGVSYFDCGADPHVVGRLIERHHNAAGKAGVVVVPALGFFGALADWTASILAEGLEPLDEIEVAYALTDWLPTPGTLAAAAALGGRRWVHANGAPELRDDQPPILEHNFRAPFGTQTALAEYPSTEPVLLPRHLAVNDIHVRMSLAGLQRVLRGAVASPHEPPDNTQQEFLIEVVVSAGGTERRARISGTDIYRCAVPVITQAVQLALAAPQPRAGVLTPAQAVNPHIALRAVSAHGIKVDHDGLPLADRA